MNKLFILTALIINLALSAVPNLIDYQGRLADANGDAITGNVSIIFSIYDSGTNRTVLWTETQSVDVIEGLFQVTLGESTTFPTDLFDGADRWIGINVAGDGEMTPRTKFTSVPYAMQAGTSAPDDDWTIDGDDVYHLNGNVGIGSANPTQRLQVTNGHLKLDNNRWITFRNSADDSDDGVICYDTNDALKLNYGVGGLIMQGGGTPHMTINNGNIGIGTTTPNYKLDVNGNYGWHAPNNFKMLGDGEFSFDFADGDGNDFWHVWDPDHSSILAVRNNGNVGIGTTTPATELEVNGTVTASSYSGTNPLYAGYFTSDYQNDNTHIIHSEYTGTGNYGVRAVYGKSTPAYNWGIGGYFVGGYTGVYGKSTTEDYYGFGGYFVGGNTGVYGHVYPTGSSSYYGVEGNVNGGYGTNYGVYGYAGGYGTNYAGYFNGNLHHTGTLSGPSDRNLKENLQPLGQALSKLMQMKVHTYNFKEQDKEKRFNLPEGKQMGLIAQELEEIYPELVKDEVHCYDLNEGKEGVEKDVHKLEYKGINYIGLIPVLTKAIQEQQEMIESQQQQIDELKKMINK
jgi:hypothetical protein